MDTVEGSAQAGDSSVRGGQAAAEEEGEGEVEVEGRAP